MRPRAITRRAVSEFSVRVRVFRGVGTPLSPLARPSSLVRTRSGRLTGLTVAGGRTVLDVDHRSPGLKSSIWTPLARKPPWSRAHSVAIWRPTRPTGAPAESRVALAYGGPVVVLALWPAAVPPKAGNSGQPFIPPGSRSIVARGRSHRTFSHSQGRTAASPASERRNSVDTRPL